MNVVFFTKYWPRRDHTGFLQRSISMIESFINLGHNITVCSDDLDMTVKQSLSKHPVTLVDINPQKVGSSLTSLKKKPNLFLFDSVETQQKYSAFLFNKWNTCPRVIDVNSLPRLQKWRKNNYRMVPNVLVPHDAAMAPDSLDQILGVEEQRSIQRCDYVLTGNQFIHHLISKSFKGIRMSHVASGYPTQEFQNQISQLLYRPYRNRNNFVYWGHMQKASNKDSLHCLIYELWPLIKTSLPEAELHIYGSGEDKVLNSRKNQLKQKGVQLKGYLESSDDVSRYRAVLYPCLHSVGPRTKILESWLNHLPVVTTPVGAEGVFEESLDMSSNLSNHEDTTDVFESEREYSQQDQESEKRIKRYYGQMKYSSHNLQKLTFGGSCANFTYSNFVENAVRLYTQEEYWNDCLKKSQQIITRKTNEFQVQKNLKKILVKIEMAVYEGRKGAYMDEWKRYSRSQEFLKRIKS